MSTKPYFADANWSKTEHFRVYKSYFLTSYKYIVNLVLSPRDEVDIFVFRKQEQLITSPSAIFWAWLSLFCAWQPQKSGQIVGSN